MRTRRKWIRARFDPETRWELAPVPPAPVRGPKEAELERLKEQLLTELVGPTESPEARTSLWRAGHEAAALAWTTSFPLLLLPELLREKVEAARSYVAKQAKVSRTSAASMGHAA